MPDSAPLTGRKAKRQSSAERTASVTLPAKDLAAALERAVLPIERRHTIPALGCARLRSLGRDTLLVTGTDMDCCLTAAAEAEVAGTLDVLLPQPAAIATALRQEADAPVRLAFGGEEGDTPTGELTVESGDLTVSLSGVLPGADMPVLETQGEETWSAGFTPEILAQLQRVARAVSHEETRYYLNGVLLEWHQDHGDWAYRLVATDGHRLYKADVDLPDVEGKPPRDDHGCRCILPEKAVRLLHKLHAGTEAVSVALVPSRRANAETMPEALGASDLLLRVRTGAAAGRPGTELVCKLIDGRFPDWARVVPKDATVRYTISRGDLQRALTAVMAGATAKRAGANTALELRYDAKPSSSGLLIKRQWADFGGAVQKRVPCRFDWNSPGGRDQSAPPPLGLNGRYLRDALDVFGPVEDLTLLLSDLSATYAIGPVRLVSDQDPAFLALVMPMRV
jgi:DNA polymerase-3 subunit beta